MAGPTPRIMKVDIFIEEFTSDEINKRFNCNRYSFYSLDNKGNSKASDRTRCEINKWIKSNAKITITLSFSIYLWASSESMFLLYSYYLVPGIDVIPSKDNFRHFFVKILGPENTPYAGKKSIWKIEIPSLRICVRLENYIF